MSQTDDIRALATEARPLFRQYVTLTAHLNRLFLKAWDGGYLDNLWELFHEDFPSVYLHYFIRARGLGDIKFGKSNHVGTRFRTLLVGLSRGGDLIACYPGTTAHESELKEDFARFRLNGEWVYPHREVLDYLRMIGSDVDHFTDIPISHFAPRRSYMRGLQ